MNLLAHLWLVRDAEDPLFRIGNLAGDFVRGVPRSSLHPRLWRGVEHHRRIDRLADDHPGSRRARERLWPRWRHWSRVLVDVFHDHFLARDWVRYGEGELRSFAEESYELLDAHRAFLPESLAAAAPRMRAHRLFESYARVDGIAAALERTSRRSRRAPALEEAVHALRRGEEAFAADADVCLRDLRAASIPFAASAPR